MLKQSSRAVSRIDVSYLKQSREREALLRRLRDVYAELVQHERNLREGEARLSIEEKLRLNPT
jgi:hypothetical protein